MSVRIDARALRAMLTSAVVGVAACASMSQPVEAPRVEVVGLSLIEDSQRNQRFLVSLSVENPNGEALVFRSMEFRIRLTGEGFIEGDTREPMLLRANDRQLLRVDVSTEFVSSVSRLMAYAQGPGNAISYALDGEFALDTRPPRFMEFEHNGRTPLIVSAAR